ncbi:hypothetical protein L0244_23535 [bacterium]|nr:hypothetical protein [bacterium]MCI0615969.1 hypothetical protein [bacterium]
MNGKRVIGILTILVLLSLMTCPLMAYPLSKPAAHDCSGKSKNNDQKQHFCCDQQAITAKVASAKASDSTIAVLNFSLSPFISHFNDHHDAAFFDKPHSDDLLLKLSILRI